MRRLMLMRHAKSDWSVGGQRDHDRALAARGRKAAPLIAAHMARHGLKPDKVLVSTARRARETWDLVAPAFGTELDASFDARLYEANPKALLVPLRAVDAAAHSLLMIGHNPGIQELANLLMASGDIDARQRLLEKFPTAALAVIDFQIDDWSALAPHSGRLDRFVSPRALATDPE